MRLSSTFFAVGYSSILFSLSGHVWVKIAESLDANLNPGQCVQTADYRELQAAGRISKPSGPSATLPMRVADCSHEILMIAMALRS